MSDIEKELEEKFRGVTEQGLHFFLGWMINVAAREPAVAEAMVKCAQNERFRGGPDYFDKRVRDALCVSDGKEVAA